MDLISPHIPFLQCNYQKLMVIDGLFACFAVAGGKTVEF
jgi:hypothetical protein